MSRQTHGGKGDTPRPTDLKKFEDNWEKIFGKKKEKQYDINGEELVSDGNYDEWLDDDAEETVIDIINAQSKCT